MDMEAQMGLTFEKVWATIQETGKKIQEGKAEHDRMIVEMRAEMKELSDNVGGVNNSLGGGADGL